MNPTLSIANWNVEWKPAKSRAGELIARMIASADPDIICLSECYSDFLAGQGWHVICADPDHGYPVISGRTKVALWSKQPWRNVTTDLEAAPSGRFIGGITDTPVGQVHVFGVCVPWEAAHVSTGKSDKKRWEDHIAYLEALLALPNVVNPQKRTLLVGDFNQTIPPKRAPAVARDLLNSLREIFCHALPKDLENRTVCHTLHTSDLSVDRREEFPSRMDTQRLSDHHGHFHRFVTADEV